MLECSDDIGDDGDGERIGIIDQTYDGDGVGVLRRVESKIQANRLDGCGAMSQRKFLTVADELYSSDRKSPVMAATS